MEHFQTYSVICEGGLDSNQNSLSLSSRTPGAATLLVNFEPSLYGGYRRISGFQPLNTTYGEVDSTNAEGKILGVFVFNNNILTARKLKAGATYNFYKYDENNPWTGYTTGLTLTSTGVDKIRYDTFNFNAAETIIFTDGVNKATLFNGTNWVAINSSNTGADFANAGGNQALATPKFNCVFKNHIFVSGDSSNPQVVAHSAPNKEYDWTVANGAGQIVVGFEVVQIKPFRDELYVFGKDKISKIVVVGTDFVLRDVTKILGCIAPDSVVEINGDLQFLSQDGFRSIAATQKIDDVDLSTLSKNIQQDVTFLSQAFDLKYLNAVVIRRKSQVRYFFSNETLEVPKNEGIIAGLKLGGNGFYWEWGRLKGIRTSTCTSKYINGEEYVLHGDYDGVVYRQEIGNSFNGSNINAIYRTPYLDFGDVFIRKTLHKIFLFVKPEGVTTLNTKITYDWDDDTVTNPNVYTLPTEISGDEYGEGVYGTMTYASTPSPILIKNVEGSGFSNRITISTNDTNACYSIQGITYEYVPNGRK